jgi:SAM-dependent methyltransferase
VSPAGGDRPWFERAFEGPYRDVYAHRDLAAARDEVAALLAPGDSPDRPCLAGRVLDLGCGFGRHALALLEQGLDVFGLDLSQDLLVRAPGLEGGERLAGRLCRGDFRRLPFAPGSFDAVLMLFSSFGYFDDATNGRVLDELARVLAPAGLVLLDLMNAERVRATLVPESRRELAGGELVETRRLLEDGRRVRKDVVLRADGEERGWFEDVRLYDARELPPLFARHGLRLLRLEGDFDGRPSDAEGPRRLAWARRA